MFVEITGDGPQVREATDLKRLAVVAPDAASLASIGSLGTVDADGEHVWLTISAFKAAAAATLPDAERAEWAEGFDGMIGFAAKHGWTNADGTAVRAHVEFAAD